MIRQIGLIATAVALVLAFRVMAWQEPTYPTYKPQDKWGEVLRAQWPEAFAEFQKATAGMSLTVDPTLVVKGGRITTQIDQKISASATVTEAEWAERLRREWPTAMAAIAKRLKDCGCRVMGVKNVSPETGVGATWGEGRGLALRFTRNASTITAHVDVLAGP